jgi:hypothetical protein
MTNNQIEKSNMAKELQPQTHLTRLARLREQREKILNLPAEKALDEIIDMSAPVPLIHSFPEQDFYFLINDIGMPDALPLLSMASDRQWEYLLDVDIWNKDRIDMQAVTKWMDLLIQADPNRFVKWFGNDKIEFFKLYLFNNIRLFIREHDQDPSDFGEGFITFDDVYYFRVMDYPTEQKPDDSDQPDRQAMLSRLLSLMVAQDHLIYQKILHETFAILPSESEEEFYRMRNIRLAEKGFLPFDEAVGIYQPVKPDKIKARVTNKIIRESLSDTVLSIPLYPVSILKEDNMFARSFLYLITHQYLSHNYS